MLDMQKSLPHGREIRLQLSRRRKVYSLQSFGVNTAMETIPDVFIQIACDIAVSK